MLKVEVAVDGLQVDTGWAELSTVGEGYGLEPYGLNPFGSVEWGAVYHHLKTDISVDSETISVAVT